LTKNFPAFTKGSYGSFDYKSFITGYLGIPLYLIMIFGYKLIYKTKGHSPQNADLWTGKAIYDRDEQLWKEKEARDKAEGKNKGGWFYRTFIGWLF